MSQPEGPGEEQESPEVKGLLLTVGGTAEPVVHTLLEIRPQHVVLVCSEQTQPAVVEVKRRVEQALFDHQRPQFKTLIIEDAANLVACHRHVANGLAYLRNDCRLQREAIRIDFTGGTKAMSAAVVLAAAPDGYCFCYVTGAKRNKEGVGVVVTGTEQMRLSENPWTVLDEPELRRLLEMASVGQWAAARDSASRLIRRSTAERGPIFRQLDATLEGLFVWDCFDHQRAWKCWREGQTPGQLRDLAAVGGLALLVEFAEKCQRMIGFLEPLAGATEPPKGKPDLLVLDMLANGDRQAERGHYDDAVLRYYRAVELFVQRRLLHQYKIDNSAVRESDVPSPLREELLSRHGPPDPDSKGWKLGRHDTTALLAAKGDPVAKRMLDREKKLDLQSRNQNWLIHGTEHVDKRRFSAYRRTILDALDIQEQKIPQWPDFRP